MNRKSLTAGVGALVLAGGGTLLATGQLSPASAHTESGTYTKSDEALGGNGGKEFDDVDDLVLAPQPLVRSLSVRGGKRVDQVRLELDGESPTFNVAPYDRGHGGSGGKRQTVLLSEVGRFIKSVAVGVEDDKVNSLIFTLSDNESLSVGGSANPTQTFTAPKGQQIIGFYGRSGDTIDKLGVIFAPVQCENTRATSEVNKIPC